MALRLVMMGTGTFALPTFRGLLSSTHVVAALFTQPDRAGRGHHHHPHPMKELALERGVPVFQPEKVNAPAALADLKSLAADLFVVAAYGQILSAELLAIPPCGAINAHASLLPKFRGAAPVQYAVWQGEQETGVTIFQIDPQLDAGQMLGVVRTPIGPSETAGELEDRLAELAVPVMLNVINQIDAGNLQCLPQDPAAVTRAPRMRKTDGEIDWSKSSAAIDCHIRAMQPWPNPYTFLEQPDHSPKRLLILEVAPAVTSSEAPPGTVIESSSTRLVVRSGDGSVEIKRLKPEGKREMRVEEFLRGHAVNVGDRFASGSV